jgi:hypothetical protein
MRVSPEGDPTTAPQTAPQAAPQAERSPRTTLASEAAARRTRAPRAHDLTDLTAGAAYPSVSVLLPTEPGPRITPADLGRLRGLVAHVERELHESDVPDRGLLLRRLRELVERAAAQPTDRGLAIYLNGSLERVFRLPLAVTARAAVERTFATRDLFTALHRMPPYVLLVLHPTCAHLYQGGDGGLRAVGDRDMFRGSGAVRVPRQGDPLTDDAEAAALDGFLLETDRLLGVYRAEHPSPLVLGGAPDLVDRFCAVSRHLSRLAGRVADPACSGVELPRASSEVVVAYLASRREEALVRLRGALATRPGDVARGMSDCWQAVHRRQPGLLLVEEGYVSPGHESDGGPVHDLVDDLMEVVILRGGQLALVSDGDLAVHGRVALISGSLDLLPARGPRTTPG